MSLDKDNVLKRKRLREMKIKFFEQFRKTKEVMNTAANLDETLCAIEGEQLVQLQKVILRMFLDIKEVCETNGITYVLNGGSALGAVRHQGFIPWDDDMDICMPRKDYNKFKMIFEKTLGDKYILNAPNYSKTVKARFPKVLAKGTKFLELGKREESELEAIFIDIFIIDNIPDNKMIRMIKGVVCNFLEFVAAQVCFRKICDYKMKELYMTAGRLGYYCKMIIGSLFSFVPLSTWYNWIDKFVQCRDENSKMCGCPTDSRHYFGYILKRSQYFPVSKGYFENHEVDLPGDVDAYLRDAYGDYLTIPKPEEREHHYVKKLEFGNVDHD